MQSTMVDITTDDGVADAYLTQPDGGGSRPGILFFPDGIGLRPRLYEMADRIAAHGYVVLIPNVFYRSGRVPLIANLDELVKSADRSALMAAIWPIASALDPASAMRDTRSYLDYLGAVAAGPEATAGGASAPAGPVGLTGYCMGAALALRTAGTYPDRVAAAGGFHGGNLATEAENSPHLLAGAITAELYFGHADNDQSMPPEQVERLNAALDAAGVRYRAEVYAGATHGYTMADTAVHSQEAEDRHWTELIALFTRALPTTVVA
jgi:carboxymethylenebutenolidase